MTVWEGDRLSSSRYESLAGTGWYPVKKRKDFSGHEVSFGLSGILVTKIENKCVCVSSKQ